MQFPFLENNMQSLPADLFSLPPGVHGRYTYMVLVPYC